MRKLALAALVALAAPAAAEEKPELVIYTYESFVSEWGPGPQIAANFEEILRLHRALRRRRRRGGAARAAASRGQAQPGRHRPRPRHQPDRRGEGDRALRAARASRRRRSTCRSPGTTTPSSPIDWGYFAFVYDRTKMPDPPKSFEDLIASKASIVIHDPRSSTPGLGLLMWVKDAYGDRAPEILEGPRPAHRDRGAGVERSLRPLPRRRGRHGARLHHLARLPPDRRG